MTKPEKVALFACSFVIAIHALGSFFPRERLWGINQLAYVPPVPRWTIITVAFLILIPKVNQIVYDLFAGFLNQVQKNLRRINIHLKYVLFSLASVIPFWLFRTTTHLLGDGHLRGSDLQKGITFKVTEPLDTYLHVLVYRLLKLDGYQAYTLTSCITGALFVFLALWLSRLLVKNNKERVFVFLLLASMGSIQLFFGYVESYTLLYVTIMAYFLFSLWFLQGKCSLVFPSLTLFLCIGLHLSALYLLPSTLYLCMAKSEKEKKTFNLEGLFSAVFILLLVGAGLFILNTHNPEKTGATSYFMSLFGSQEDPYSLFSFAHLLDIINEQLLLSPAGIILWAVVILCARKINFRNKMVIFFMIVILSSFLLAFLIDPELGYGRDWDLFSSTALGYTLLGVYLMLQYLRKSKIKKTNYLILAIVATTLFSTLPWVYVNAREDKAVERFKALLEVDRVRSGYGHEILAYYYEGQGLLNEEAKQWEMAFSVVNNIRYAVNLGRSYRELGRHPEAIAMFNQAIQMDPNFAKSYLNLGHVLFDIGEYDEAQKQFQMAIDRDPYLWDAYTNKGASLIKIQRYEDAVKVLESGIQLNPNLLSAYFNMAMAYHGMGKSDQIVPLFRAYLQRNPQDYQKVQNLLKKMNIDLD